MKLKSITIEGMHNVDHRTYEFDSKSKYLCGNNGAGKSTILQAIQLALLGYIPGTNKQTSAIFAHSNNDTMAVTAVIDDNGSIITIRRKYVKLKGRITSDISVTPSDFDISNIIGKLELPIYNFSEMLSLSGNALKNWFVSNFVSSSADLDWELELQSIHTAPDFALYEDTYSELISFAATQPQSIEGVRAVNEYVKELISAKTAEAKSLQGMLESLVYYEDYTGSTDIDSMKVTLSELFKVRSEKVADIKINSANQQYLQALKQYDGLEDDIHSNVEYSDLLERKVVLQNQIQIDTETINKNKAALSQMHAQLDNSRRIISGGGTCPYTNEHCKNIELLITEAQSEFNSLSDRISDMQTSIDDSEQHVYELRRNLSEVMNKLTSIEKKFERRDTLRNSIVDISHNDTGESLQEIDDKIAILSSDISKCEANQRYTDLQESATKDKFKLDSEILMLKSVDKLTGISGLQSKLSVAAFDNISKYIDNYLYLLGVDKSITSKFNVTSSSNSFSFGICREGVYIAFDMLSSGEKCIFTFAMMLAFMDISDCPLKLIIVDDLTDHLDKDNFYKVTSELFNTIDTQVIVAGVQPIDSDNCIRIS